MGIRSFVCQLQSQEECSGAMSSGSCTGTAVTVSGTETGTATYPTFKIPTDMKDFLIFFRALTRKPGKSPWGSSRDRVLPNYFRGLVRAPALAKKRAATGKELLPK